jgi:flagellar biosynthesis/type III secretory pathway M-ring protein FliF/YscJ
MTYVIVLAVLFAVVLVVTAPLRRAAAGAEPRPDDEAGATSSRAETEDRAAEILELEAARDAKYRELRDAELDHQTGKLSDADYEALDRTLRAEAIAILRRLDRASGRR